MAHLALKDIRRCFVQCIFAGMTPVLPFLTDYKNFSAIASFINKRDHQPVRCRPIIAKACRSDVHGVLFLPSPPANRFEPLHYGCANLSRLLGFSSRESSSWFYYEYYSNRVT